MVFFLAAGSSRPSLRLAHLGPLSLGATPSCPAHPQRQADRHQAPVVRLTTTHFPDLRSLSQRLRKACLLCRQWWKQFSLCQPESKQKKKQNHFRLLLAVWLLSIPQFLWQHPTFSWRLGQVFFLIHTYTYSKPIHTDIHVYAHIYVALRRVPIFLRKCQ